MSNKPVVTQPTAFLPSILTVVITGASSGIGLAQTLSFLKAGHRVIAVDIQPFPVEQQWGANTFQFVQADVSQKQGVAQVVERLVATFNHCDVLCNTAGILDDFLTIEQIDEKYWEHIWRTNVTSQFLMSQALLPFLLRNATSRIINMASIASLTAGGGGVAYTASKHAVAGLTKQLAYDYANKGLRVNAIAPGAIQTAMTKNDFTDDQKMAQWVADETPVKRWAQADEVAQLTLFLASDASDYMTGNIIPLDGGWLIR